MDGLTIGKVARLAGVGVETIRFYQRKGLIDQPPRRDSGYRQYPAETVGRLRFIRRAKELGFTLKQIRELLNLRLDLTSHSTCEAVRTMAQEKIEDIRSRIIVLQRMEGVLQQLISDCHSRSLTGGCPILKAIDEPE